MNVMIVTTLHEEEAGSSWRAAYSNPAANDPAEGRSAAKP